MTLPSVAVLKDVHIQMPLQIFSSDDKLIAEVGDVKRIPITLKQVPQQLIQATLATEDQRFYDHPGIDILGLARAAIVLLATGEKRQGGSTITMQVARNFFLTSKKTYLRKFREILLALKIDHIFTKDKILELYFNKIFYGNRAYGIAAAAKIYYGKNLNQLTLPEMAMLAGIPQAPSKNNPLANPRAALKRRNHVLERMLEEKFIDRKTYYRAIAAPITARYHGFKVSLHAPYVTEMVRQIMLTQFGKKIYDHGYIVYTTIDSRLQKAANQAVFDAILAYDQRHGYRGAEQNIGAPTLSTLKNWIKILRRTPSVNRLQPALVVSVTANSADILLKTGNVETIKWQDMQWARREIIRNNQEYLGTRPKYASDILHVGDLIRIQPNSDNTWHLAQIPKVESAFVSLNPKNGAILALVGGFNFYNSSFNRAIQAQRQPGSSIKPFIYSAALQKGFTLASLVNDAPIVVKNSGWENNIWRPENDTRKFYGPTRLRVALNHSRNMVSIRLLQQIGIPYAIDYLTRFGFKREQLPPTLSLALGTAEVTPLEMATAYSVFANGGYKVTPYFIDRVVDFNTQQIIYHANPQIAANDDLQQTDIKQQDKTAPRVISSQNAYLINSALLDVIQHGTGKNALVLHRSDLAGKTGTTNSQKDAWFSGFNSNLVAIAWIGFDKPRSLYEYAVNAALPMWIDFMKTALQNQAEASMLQPSDIITVRIDKTTGLLAEANNQNAIFEIFRKEYIPTQQNHASAINVANHDSNNSGEASLDQLY
jgi:penicillin-binding protein 1A